MDSSQILEEDCEEKCWKIYKGIPCNVNTVVDAIYSCYNFLISRLLDDKQDASLTWYNKEVNTCFCKVLAVLDDEEFSLSAIDSAVSEDIILYIAKITSHQGLTCGMYHALESLTLCIALIWNLKTVQDRELENGRCTRLASAFNTGAFDCVIDDDKRCKSAPDISISFLGKIFEPTVAGAGKNSDAFQHYNAYGVAFAQYKEKEYRSCLETLHSFLRNTDAQKDDLLQRNFADIYNLIGCCYGNLGQLHTSIVYFRKAVLCRDNNFACHLNNIAVVYKQLEKMEAASQATDILVSSFKLDRTERQSEHILIFHSKNHLQVELTTNISHWGWPKTSLDYITALYLGAKTDLQAGLFEKASEYYAQLLSNQSHAITLGTSESCLAIPPLQQILAEKHLAESSCCPPEKIENATNVFRDVKDKLTGYVRELDRVLIRLDDTNLHSALKNVISIGRKLYHCICCSVCLTRQFFTNIDEVDTFSSYDGLKDWQPEVYVLPQLEQTGPNEKEVAAAEDTVKYLNHIQAHFLLNKAIILTWTSSDQKSEVLKILQSVLKFAPQDIEIRWKLTLLLWQLGHKIEACKTWLRTRGLDQRMGNKEIASLVAQRTSANIPENKKLLYQRDIAILKEVFRSRQAAYGHVG